MSCRNYGHLARSKPALSEPDLSRMRHLVTRTPGYSDSRHYAFFQALMQQTEIRDVLVVGVYFGRDIVFLLEAARACGRSIRITGVDKFSDDFCDDWPSYFHGCRWSEAGAGSAPSLQAAIRHIEPFAHDMQVTLVRQRDEDFLASCRSTYDFIYLDTAHDQATVVRQLRQAAPLLAKDGLIAGDDYADAGTWGVQSALRAAAPRHLLYDDWIWIVPHDQLAAEPAGARAAVAA